MIINSESKPTVEDVYALLSNEMLVEAAERGREISEDPKEVIEKLETKYGKVWAWKYSIFYYYYFKLGSEMLIG